jgi:hypothetical protein
MVFLAQLWLPVVVSAVLVFLASAAFHMLVPFRQREWQRPPDEGALQAALRQARPGLYAFPLPANPRERGRPEALARWAEGPSGWLAVVPPGPIDMGRNLGLSLLLNLAVSAVVAYVAFHALGGGARYGAVFRLVGTVGFLAYAVGAPYESIWFWRPWRSSAMTLVEALGYGLLMAGTFGWLWPR